MKTSYGRSNFEKTKKMTLLAVLAAVVVVFQLIGGYLKIGATSISIVLIPIVLGGVILGAKAGAFLGFVFGAVTFFCGLFGTDMFTNYLISVEPFWTAVICFGKGTLAGLVSALLYKLIAGKNKFTATLVASMAAPVVNTGLFILGGLTVVAEALSGQFVAEGTTLVYFLVIGCAGINFLVEFAVNVVMSPVIKAISDAAGKKF